MPRQAGFVRGVVIANNPGDLVVQSSRDLSYHYRTDNKTWIEREEERIRVSDLHLGEILEVVSDRDPQLVRYARLVHVIPKSRTHPVNFSAGGVYRLSPTALAESGSLTFTGIISGREGQHLTLRTRFDGEIPIFLRQDTHLVSQGQEAEPGELLLNTRVFIRAARNRDNEIEAFEIVWGGILEPNQR
jgi:hypothetical protein